MILTLGMPGLGTAEEPTAFPKGDPKGRSPKGQESRDQIKTQRKHGSMGECEPAWDCMTLEVFSNCNDFMS